MGKDHEYTFSSIECISVESCTATFRFAVLYDGTAICICKTKVNGKLSARLKVFKKIPKDQWELSEEEFRKIIWVPLTECRKRAARILDMPFALGKGEKEEIIFIEK